jgi:hypothetical protein
MDIARLMLLALLPTFNTDPSRPIRQDRSQRTNQKVNQTENL